MTVLSGRDGKAVGVKWFRRFIGLVGLWWNSFGHVCVKLGHWDLGDRSLAWGTPTWGVSHTDRAQTADSGDRCMRGVLPTPFAIDRRQRRSRPERDTPHTFSPNFSPSITLNFSGHLWFWCLRTLYLYFVEGMFTCMTWSCLAACTLIEEDSWSICHVLSA